MSGISLGRAKRYEIEIDAVVRELNRQMINASMAGMTIEASIVEFCQLGQADLTPLLNVSVRVRPDRVVVGPEEKP